jgi:hypothetical protein
MKTSSYYVATLLALGLMTSTCLGGPLELTVMNLKEEIEGTKNKVVFLMVSITTTY